MGVLEVITIILAVAKVLESIDLTWLQVFLPMIIGYPIIILLYIILLITTIRKY